MLPVLVLPSSSPSHVPNEPALRAELAAAEARLRQALLDGEQRLQAERRQFAQTLHDTLAQTLTAAYLQALTLSRNLQQSGSASADEAAHLADTIHRTVRETQIILRQLSSPNDLPPESSPARCSREFFGPGVERNGQRETGGE